MDNPKCENCKKNFKVLTKEKLCTSCFKDEFGYWPNDFCSKEERLRRNKGGKKF